MRRREVAGQYGIGESRLRWYENEGFLPAFADAKEDEYRARLELILAGDRAGLSGQRVRRALGAALSPERGNEMTVATEEGRRLVVHWDEADGVSPSMFSSMVDYFAACGFALAGVEGSGVKLLAEYEAKNRSAPASRPAGDSRLRRLLEREAELNREGDAAATMSEPHRMLDVAVRPRAGESAGDAIVRRHREHVAKMRIEGRVPLMFSEWMEHDRVLHESVYLLREQESAAPANEAAARQAKALGEIDSQAKVLMRKSAVLTLSEARAKVMSENPALTARYTAAVQGRPEPGEED